MLVGERIGPIRFYRDSDIDRPFGNSPNGRLVVMAQMEQWLFRRGLLTDWLIQRMTPEEGNRMQTLYAMFDDSSLALKAVAALLRQGVRTADISVITKDRTVDDDNDECFPMHDGAADTRSDNHKYFQVNDGVEDTRSVTQGFGRRELDVAVEKNSAGDSLVDAAAGAGIGLGVGLTAVLVSIAVPGFGVILGGGALACAIASATTAAAAGAFAGGILGHFRDAGLPDQEAESFVRAYEEGWAIVAVEVPDGVLDKRSAEQILNKYQAKNVNTFDGSATVTA